MAGLAKICKLYGSMEVIDKDGSKTLWVWDYKQNKPVVKSTKKIKKSKKKNQMNQNKVTIYLLDHDYGTIFESLPKLCFEICNFFKIYTNIVNNYY